ncbi:MAG: tripartite tricarboxylate transporter substrate binding protein [Casimicrobiaceae bacterium]
MSVIARIMGVAIAAASAVVATQTFAASWPDKPVKIIVPFAPGGTTDTLVRNIQRVAEEKKLLPQPLTVINVGGHFSVGGNQVKNAAQDGYTFLAVHLALLSGEIVDPNRKLSYRDFAPVALTGGFCLHPVVRADAPWKTLAELLAAAKEKPNTIIFGVNVGALNHLGGGMLEAAFPGARFRFVQIGGGAENFAALKGANTQVSMLSSSEYQNFKAGGVRALGYTGAERLKLEPDIQTMREQGLDFDFCINNYWLAPKGTPKEAIDGMAAMLQKAMASPEMQAAQAKQASSSEFLSGAAFQKSLDDTFKAIEPVARSLVKK